MNRIILGLFALAVIKCPDNCVPHGIVCACDAPSESATQTYVPSNEKPPNHGGKREEVNAVTPTSLKAQDEKGDEENRRYYEKLGK
jgi:hypothetical protein